jgi:hypothetical protein
VLSHDIRSRDIKLVNANIPTANNTNALKASIFNYSRGNKEIIKVDIVARPLRGL